MSDKLENALKWIVSILQKHDVPYQIKGGVAAHIYGSKRPINDIDLDVPEDKMAFLVPDIERYITSGPGHHKGSKWDLTLITLNYNGQGIDIGGAFETKIFDDRRKVWVHCPAKLETAQTHDIFGIEVPVAAPKDLIEYKKLLAGKHQAEDIAAIRRYMTTSK